MREIRRILTPKNPNLVLHEFASELLADQNQSVPDIGLVHDDIVSEIDLESSQLLADIQADYEAFENLRTQAVHAYGRLDPVVCILVGAIVSLLFLIIAGPEVLPFAAVHPGLGLSPWVLVMLVTATGVRLVPWRRRRVTLMREVSTAYRLWTDALREQVLAPVILEKLNDEKRNSLLFDTAIGAKSPPQLLEGNEPRRLVVTDDLAKVRTIAQSVRSGSLGVSGPRGVGKSTILNFFGTETADGDGGDLRLVVSAPVDYEPKEFIIHLFGRLCEAVLHDRGDRSPIARETRHHMEQLKFLRTYSTNWSASLIPRAFLTVTGGYAKQRAEQPVTLPDLVGSLRSYISQVVSWKRSPSGGGGQVVIAIDEVDKIRDSERAEAFVNDIKAIFGMPGCLYLVTLSEDAMSGFARRSPSIRSAFDSAFDEVITVGSMSYQHSEQLLFKRVTGVPRPFAALCHVLTGGLPRDLVRTARSLIDVTSGEGGKRLPETASDLIHRELTSLRQTSVRQLAEVADAGPLLTALYDPSWPGTTPEQFTAATREAGRAMRNAESEPIGQLYQEIVVALSFYRTVLEAFDSGSLNHLVACLKERKYAVIDDLAAVRYAMRVNTKLAHDLLETYRQVNGMGPKNVVSQTKSGAGSQTKSRAGSQTKT
jgi:hypothetical protein